MPGMRCLSGATDGKRFYYVNRPSAATPDGFGQERTIRQIWWKHSDEGDPTK